MSRITSRTSKAIADLLERFSDDLTEGRPVVCLTVVILRLLKLRCRTKIVRITPLQWVRGRLIWIDVVVVLHMRLCLMIQNGCMGLWDVHSRLGHGWWEVRDSRLRYIQEVARVYVHVANTSVGSIDSW